MTVPQLLSYGADAVAIASAVNLILPPWEKFAAWPRFQSVYRLMMVFIGYWANLNFKSRLWPEISVDNQVKKIINGGANGKTPIPTPSATGTGSGA